MTYPLVETKGSTKSVDESAPYYMTAEFVTLGTKDGPALTCSEYIAKKRFSNYKVAGLPSFEEGAKRVKTGWARALLVPNAYPLIDTFYMDEDLIPRETFLADIPALGLVKNDKSSKVIDKFYYHPATLSLLPKLFETVDTPIEASSNVKAYTSMLEGGQLDACMTNALVAQHYGQELHRVLRAAKPMGWTVFERA